jgi:hypothetical protein
MSEKQIKFLETLRAMYADSPFSPLEAMESFTLNALPESVRGYLVVHGPGIGATKAMTRELAALGVRRLPERTNTGYLWVLA